MGKSNEVQRNYFENILTMFFVMVNMAL